MIQRIDSYRIEESQIKAWHPRLSLKPHQSIETMTGDLKPSNLPLL